MHQKRNFGVPQVAQYLMHGNNSFAVGKTRILAFETHYLCKYESDKNCPSGSHFSTVWNLSKNLLGIKIEKLLLHRQ